MEWSIGEILESNGMEYWKSGVLLEYLVSIPEYYSSTGKSRYSENIQEYREKLYSSSIRVPKKNWYSEIYIEIQIEHVSLKS